MNESRYDRGQKGSEYDHDINRYKKNRSRKKDDDSFLKADLYSKDDSNDLDPAESSYEDDSSDSAYTAQRSNVGIRFGSDSSGQGSYRSAKSSARSDRSGSARSDMRNGSARGDRSGSARSDMHNGSARGDRYSSARSDMRNGSARGDRSGSVRSDGEYRAQRSKAQSNRNDGEYRAQRSNTRASRSGERYGSGYGNVGGRRSEADAHHAYHEAYHEDYYEEGYDMERQNDYNKRPDRSGSRNTGKNNRGGSSYGQNINGLLIGIAVVLSIVVLVLVVKVLFTKKDPTETNNTPAAQSQDADGGESDAASGSGAADGSEDTEAPLITGVENKTITVGDTISYLSGVTATDNVDGNVDVEVDASNVNLNTPGEYTVTYTAADKAGNQAQVEATVTVLEKETEGESENSENLATLNSLANMIIKRILTDDMTDMEKLGRIYDWVRFECDYVDTSDKSSWVNAALSMIDTRKGDCFSYYAVAKALLQSAGFETVDVEKSNIEHSRHYWSLVKIDDGWYHYDTTPRHGDGDYFCMVTDAQLEEYSAEHEDSHIWDKSIYPTVSEKVITDMTAEDGNVPVYKLNY